MLRLPARQIPSPCRRKASASLNPFSSHSHCAGEHGRPSIAARSRRHSGRRSIIPMLLPCQSASNNTPRDRTMRPRMENNPLHPPTSCQPPSLRCARWWNTGWHAYSTYSVWEIDDGKSASTTPLFEQSARHGPPLPMGAATGKRPGDRQEVGTDCPLQAL
jgi:hypothetical protein